MPTLNLDDFLFKIYGINYKHYEYGYCHEYNHNYEEIDRKVNIWDDYIFSKFHAVPREEIKKVIRKFKIDYYEREYDRKFFEKLKELLPRKVKEDFKNLCDYLNEFEISIELNFEKDIVLLDSDYILKKCILMIENKVYDTNYTWDEFVKEKLKLIRSYQPPAIKEHLKYTEKDVLPYCLYYLRDFEKYFPTGKNIFKFDLSEISVTASYNYDINKVEQYIRNNYIEAYIDQPSIYQYLKRREAERLEEERKKELRKQRAKERRRQLKELAKKYKEDDML